MTTLSVGFNDTEDRLGLVIGSEALLLTRRLTARLINGIAAVLERSSVPASRAPDEMRSDIILMEHQGALASVGQGSGAKGRAGAGDPKKRSLPTTARLVTSIDLATKPKTFHLVFKAKAGEPVSLVLSRIDLHRVVETLKGQAEKAGWNLPIEVKWLDEDQGQLTVH